VSGGRRRREKRGKIREMEEPGVGMGRIWW
jgi:hypothetical protein